MDSLSQALRSPEFKSILAAKGIIVSTDERMPDYWHLSYGPASDRDCAFTAACRGTTVDMAEQKVISPGLTRFFNEAEPQAAPIDWTSAKVYEKLDGSLIKLWYSEKYGRWVTSTRGSLMASGRVSNYGFNFDDLFAATVRFDIEKLNKSIIYYFELCTRFNKIVVQYSGDFVNLIAARSAHTFQEFSPEDIGIIDGLPVVPQVTDFREYVEGLTGTEGEGVVVVDKDYRRIKIKAADYVKRHYYYNTTAEKLWLLPDNDIAEIVGYFPEKAKAITDIELKLSILQAQVDKVTCLGYKELGLSNTDPLVKQAAFVQKRKGLTVRDWCKSMNHKKLAGVIS